MSGVQSRDARIVKAISDLPTMARESVTLHDSEPTVVINPSYPIPSLQVKYSSMLPLLEKDNRITTGTTLQQESFSNSHLRSPSTNFYRTILEIDNLDLATYPLIPYEEALFSSNT